MAYLEERGIGTLIQYPVPPHLSEAYADLGFRAGDFPLSEKLAESVLSLPIGTHLGFENAGRIVNCVKEFCRG